MKIVYGKLGAIRVVTSQLGFARPFSIRFFARNVVPTVIWQKWHPNFNDMKFFWPLSRCTYLSNVHNHMRIIKEFLDQSFKQMSSWDSQGIKNSIQIYEKVLFPNSQKSDTRLF